MFRQRLFATLVLAPLVLLAIYTATPWVFNEIILLLLVICAWEWLQLIPIQRLPLKIAFILLFFVIVWFNWHSYFLFSLWFILGALCWALILVAVLCFPRMQVLWGYPWMVASFCFVLLPLFAQSIIALFQQAQGRDLLVYLLFLVWGTDIGAYLMGKCFGKHKLIPEVSPGKSVEGAVSALVFVLFIAWGGYVYFQPKFGLLPWLLMALATAGISVLGDLSISLLKRRVHIKDTGHLIPGHGGLLDRLDSLIAAAPLFYLSCGGLYP